MSRYENHTTAIHNEEGKRIGYIRGDTFYRTFRDAHVLRKPEPSLAIGEYALRQLVAHGVTRLEYKNRETGAIYRASLAHFLAKSIPLDRGYGPQRALSLNGWIQERPGQAVMFGGVR
jgi:hypothetical protein